MGGIVSKPGGAALVLGVLGIACVTSLATAQRATAAEVSLRSNEEPFSTLRVVERGREQNDVVVRVVESGSALVVRDDGADLKAGRGCTLRGGRRPTARCELDPPSAERGGLPGLRFEFLRVLVKTGGLEDRVGIVGRSRYEANLLAFAFVSAGAGDDRIAGGRMSEYIAPGTGDDWVDTGRGPDEVAAERGPDGDDRIEGGGRADSLSYFRRTDSVVVDLRAGLAGSAGETDLFTDIHGAIGGRGADLLRGGGAANFLYGAGGPDDLYSFAGRDWIDGGPGIDQFAAGTGSDLVIGEDDRAETLDCGPQRDFVAPDTIDTLVSCEEFASVITVPARGFAARFDRALSRTGASPPRRWSPVRRYVGG